MPDEKPNESPSDSHALPRFEPAAGFPPPNVPTVFADGITNVAPSRGVVKCYLYRTDPEISGQNSYKNQVIAQVVMPLEAFVFSIAFLYKSLDSLVKQGMVTKEYMDSIIKSTESQLNT